MKRNFLYACLIALASVGFTACESDENGEYGDEKIPEGALPTTEFTLGNLDDEPYAEDAIRIVAEGKPIDDGDRFVSIELFGDGHYLICFTAPSNAPKQTVKVKHEADGSVSIFKKGGAKRMATRAAADGTRTASDGSFAYGTYTRTMKGVYRFNDGATLDLRDVEKERKPVVYTNKYGLKSTVYVRVDSKEKTKPLQNICRAWQMNSVEVWQFINGAYIAHGKQWLEEGVVSHYIDLSPAAEKLGYSKKDILDEDYHFCKRVIFSSTTYLCIYMDHSMEERRWEWQDEQNGILRFWDSYDSEDEDWMGDTTVRFKGKQMRIYEDYTEEESGLDFRMICVNTLTAGY